jgi:predicted peroxiredoxin
MGKVAITVNGDQPGNVYPAFIIGSSAIASGEDLIIFFTPAGAPLLKKGVLENMKVKGLPDMADLVEGVLGMDGKIYLCELAFEVKDMKPEDLMEGVTIVGATTFVCDAVGANLSLSF